MTRRLILGFVIAAIVAGVGACAKKEDVAPAAPTPTAATPAPDTTVDRFIGAWSTDPADGGPSELDGPENTADSIDPNGACRFIEFKVDREPDSRSAKIALAAKCANARIRGVGAAVLIEGVLHWKARGVIGLPTGQKCAFQFVEGNRAVRVPEGLKVHYNGTVCDVHVRGAQIVRKRP
jgi:hypothetical protein